MAMSERLREGISQHKPTAHGESERSGGVVTEHMGGPAGEKVRRDRPKDGGGMTERWREVRPARRHAATGRRTVAA
jgi:hypothetical protein